MSIVDDDATPSPKIRKPRRKETEPRKKRVVINRPIRPNSTGKPTSQRPKRIEGETDADFEVRLDAWKAQQREYNNERRRQKIAAGDVAFREKINARQRAVTQDPEKLAKRAAYFAKYRAENPEKVSGWGKKSYAAKQAAKPKPEVKPKPDAPVISPPRKSGRGPDLVPRKPRGPDRAPRKGYAMRVDMIAKRDREAAAALLPKRRRNPKRVNNTGIPRPRRPVQMNDETLAEFEVRQEQWRVNSNAYSAEWNARKKTDAAYRAELRIRRNKRYADNVQHRLRCLLRSRLQRVLMLRGIGKSESAKRLVGCSIDQLRGHLEGQFRPGMTWERQEAREIEIDHIIPCAAFDLRCPLARVLCFGFWNLQPLWMPENRRKHSKYVAR